MGKRSNFKRRKNDTYDTPREAVIPLVPHLPEDLFVDYAEPCAGRGDLLVHLDDLAACCAAWVGDIEPRSKNARWNKKDALTITEYDIADCDLIITNPPWTREILHPMIEHFSAMRPTWLLFDADWMHTKQAIPYLKLCRKIVSVGRVKWVPDSPHTGKDNAAWYLFDANTDGPIEFVGRAE